MRIEYRGSVPTRHGGRINIIVTDGLDDHPIFIEGRGHIDLENAEEFITRLRDAVRHAKDERRRERRERERSR